MDFYSVPIPTSMEYDAQIDNEGEGNFSANRQQGGVVGGTNIQLGCLLGSSHRDRSLWLERRVCYST